MEVIIIALQIKTGIVATKDILDIIVLGTYLVLTAIQAAQEQNSITGIMALYPSILIMTYHSTYHQR